MKQLFNNSLQCFYKALMLLCLLAFAQDALAQPCDYVVKNRTTIVGERFNYRIKPNDYRGILKSNERLRDLDPVFTYLPFFPDTIQVQVPNDVEFDAENGIISWTPSMIGDYGFGVRVQRNNDICSESQEIYFHMNVINPFNAPEMCATIAGTVRGDDDPNMTKEYEGIVQIINVNAGAYFPAVNFFETEINENGSFSCQVPEGAYALLFITDDYLLESYFDDDEIVSVQCGDQTDLTVNLTAEQEYHITGRVYDENTNEPIPARVFARLNFNGGNHGNVYIAYDETDENGNYDIEYSGIGINDISLTFEAVPMNRFDYLIEYYNNVQSRADAEFIPLYENRSGIDFSLPPTSLVQNGNCEISGLLCNDDRTPLTGTVTLINNTREYSVVNYQSITVETDENGRFEFDNLPDGTYILFAEPESRDYIAGYYFNNEDEYWNWREARNIVVNSENSTQELVFTLDERYYGSYGSEGRIRGRIRNGENNNGKIATDGQYVASKDLLSGVLVTVYNNEDRPISYIYSDANGEFDFSELSVGNYTLTASKLGYESAKANIEIEEGKLISDVNITLSKINDETNSVEDAGSVQNMALYPNPVNTSATLKFNSTSENAIITISDLQGRTLVTTYHNGTIGENNVKIDASDLDSGAYLVKITINGTSSIIMMNVVK